MKRKKENLYGQFHTEEDLSNFVLNKVNECKEIKGKVLEPSFGKGSFIDNLVKYDCEITGVEIDKELFDNYHKETVNLINGDFIFCELNENYDFIVGNPPYIELCYSFYDERTRDVIKIKNREVSNGRLNLVHAFFNRTFQLLNNDGIIAFLLPSSILTSPVYKKIRRLIFQKYNIEYLQENVNFKNVAIQVCLLIIRKVGYENRNGKYFYLNNDNYYIMEDYEKFRSMKKTLKEDGFFVKIGPVVWNQVKDNLTDNESNNMLIYSSNIKKGGLHFKNSNNVEKKQYIKDNKVTMSDCVIMPRTISKEIKYALVQNNNNMIFENHVITITHKNKEKLLIFYENLDKGVYDELLLSFFNSSNLTVQEVLSLPI